MNTDDLKGLGMVENINDPVLPYSKDLSGRPEDEDSEAYVELAVYTGRNQHEFVLSTPDSFIFLAVESIEDLRTLERLIVGVELK